ncbi:hypothetical protein Agub_g1202, partial [Astrephomene gubernaculifera]
MLFCVSGERRPALTRPIHSSGTPACLTYTQCRHEPYAAFKLNWVTECRDARNPTVTAACSHATSPFGQSAAAVAVLPHYHPARRLIITCAGPRLDGRESFDNSHAGTGSVFSYATQLYNGTQPLHIEGIPHSYAWVPFRGALYLPLWLPNGHHEWWRLRRVPKPVPREVMVGPWTAAEGAAEDAAEGDSNVLQSSGTDQPTSSSSSSSSSMGQFTAASIRTAETASAAATVAVDTGMVFARAAAAAAVG